MTRQRERSDGACTGHSSHGNLDTKTSAAIVADKLANADRAHASSLVRAYYRLTTSAAAAQARCEWEAQKRIYRQGNGP